MNSNKLTATGSAKALSIALAMLVASAHAALTDLAPGPVITSSATAVQPNLMFILDDSGSMESDFMPDYVVGEDHCLNEIDSSGGNNKRCRKKEGGGDPPFHSPEFNSVYYNPTIDYLPAVTATNVAIGNGIKPAVPVTDTATHPWNAILRDPFLSSTATTNLRRDLEEVLYCDNENGNNWSTTADIAPGCVRNGKDVYPITGYTGSGNFASPRQWRSTSTGNPAYETVYCTASTAAGPFTENPLRSTCRRQLNGYVVPGFIATSPTTNTSFSRRNELRVANPFYYRISSVQWCNSAANAASAAPATGTCKVQKDATYRFVRYGTFTRVDIDPARASFPGASGGTRTYAQEMNNFANWYSFYRTRMQMMKTSSGRAFTVVDDKFRVGLLTINQSGSDTNKYLRIASFDATQKADWYKKFYEQQSNSGTPLRYALSRVGQLFAGKTLHDPMQYSCQKNFAFLSTDGFWNGGAGFDINGNAVGNQDNVNSGFSPRPKYDGNLAGNVSAGSSAGGRDTLADVAMYYYKTDLRQPGAPFSNCNVTLPSGVTSNVCEDNVPSTTKDPASHQHMTTFTIGLGVDGTLLYTPNYEQGGSSDFNQIKSGAKNWPPAQQNAATAVDDLWHAAVNGGGTYYSAKDPRSLADGLGDALREIGSRTGAASAAATSNPNVVAGDNFIFSTTYRTGFWDGQLVRQSVNLRTGQLTPVQWAARELLNLPSKVQANSDNRTIYTYAPGTSNKLKPFEWNSLSSTEQAYFKPSLLSQAAFWTTTEQAAATGESLLKFLRGQSGFEEETTNTNKLYRDREFVLGDTVNAEAAYVKRPIFDYKDAGYSGYRSAKASRQGMVYVAANDGMLHAFRADTGEELWAHVPSQVMPRMYKLADRNYGHEFYVDGTPVIGDIQVGGAWKTILVGGFNRGGRGYYALDVTDPVAPKALWEFGVNEDSDMGLSYGKPVITKLHNGSGTGQWVVLVSSGYNNVSPGDGKGYLFVLNANTGSKIDKLGTGEGSTGTPSGLGKISAWVDSPDDNTAMRVYGGDLLGNLWRFDINNMLSGPEAVKLARLTGSSGNAVSITAKPELGEIGGKAVVFVGTGRLLGTSDLVDTSPQAFFAIKDELTSSGWGDIRSGGSLVQQSVVNGVSALGEAGRVSATGSPTVDWAAKAGWVVDLPDAGERNNTDPVLVGGTIVFTTNVPSTTAVCSAGGYSYTYYLDYRSGTAVASADASGNGQPMAAYKNSSAYSNDVKAISYSNKTVGLVRDSTGHNNARRIPISLAAEGVKANWREIITDERE